MKKILAVLIIALVVLTSASAFRFKSVGFVVGQGYFVTADMEIIDNLDIYAGIGYTGNFGLTSGVEYKVASFDVGNTPVAVRPGVQLAASFGSGASAFTLHGTCAFSFEADSLSAFLRPGLGVYLAPYKGETGTSIYADFSFVIEAGVSYLLK